MDSQMSFDLESEDSERSHLSGTALLVAYVQFLLAVPHYSDTHFPGSDRRTRHRRRCQNSTACVDPQNSDCFDLVCLVGHIVLGEHDRIFVVRWYGKTCLLFCDPSDD